MIRVLVTGARGQLGKCLQNSASAHPRLKFTFTDANNLDISNTSDVLEIFKKTEFNYCINCAAYTAVDKAEEQEELCYKINAEGPKNLAAACKSYGVTLIHISTDFVFDGSKPEPYTEEDNPDPINVYGRSKLKGEENIAKVLNNYFILRTSWLYSEYGHNFMKTMLKLGRERNELAVVNDQIGSPTYARDLAEFALQLIVREEKAYGLYHYSNEGAISWYHFASEIFKQTATSVTLKPIASEAYPTAAKRPKNSTLSKDKVKRIFKIQIPTWSESLRKCLTFAKEISEGQR